MPRVSTLIISGALTGSLAIALSACGGSSNKTASTGGAGNSDTTTTRGGGTGGSSEISDLVKKAKSANVKVTYKTSGSDNTLTLAQYNGDSSMTSGDSTIVTNGGKSYSCNGQGSGATCTELPGGAAMGNTLLTGFFGVYSALFQAPDTASKLLGVSKSSSNETIAGRDAKCSTLSASAFGRSGDVTVCVDSKTGVLLKGATSAAGQSSSIEATEFAESTADDVKLPATPTQLTMPSIPLPSIPVPTSY